MAVDVADEARADRLVQLDVSVRAISPGSVGLRQRLPGLTVGRMLQLELGVDVR
jgi:hypothetical protein